MWRTKTLSVIKTTYTWISTSQIVVKMIKGI